MNNYQDNYQKLLGSLGNEQAPEGLYRRFALAVGSLVASVVAAVSAVLVLLSSLTTSGFWKFVSLIFSDGGTVMTYWQQFSLSLLESFSMPELVVSLACVFAVLLSLRFLLKNKKAFSNNLQLKYV